MTAHDDIWKVCQKEIRTFLSNILSWIPVPNDFKTQVKTQVAASAKKLHLVHGSTSTGSSFGAPNFPDLNSIENQWGELKRRVHKGGPRTLEDMELLLWDYCVMMCALIFFALHSPVTNIIGEDTMLLLGKRVAQNIKCRGYNNCHRCGFVKNNFELFTCLG